MESIQSLPAQPPPSPRRRWLFFAGVFLLAVAVYLPTLGYGFVFDDQVMVIENRFAQSWQFIPRYFTEHVWSELHVHVLPNYYRPVFLLWILFNYSLFGLAPAGWHATLVLLHGGVSLLACLFAERLSGDFRTGLFCGLLFALHPIHLESVAWVSAVPEPLAAFFLLTAFLAWLRYRDELARGAATSRRWLAFSLGLAALAALSKEVGTVLPLLVFAYEWVRLGFELHSGPAAGRLAALRARFERSLRASAPFFVLFAIYLMVRVAVLGALSHGGKLPLSTVLFTIPSLLASYARHLLWPWNLSPFYDSPYITAFSAGRVLVPLLTVVAIVLLLWWLGRRSMTIAVASSWLAIPVLPLLNLRVFPENEILHDRYLYLSSLGWCLLLAVAVRAIAPRGRSALQFAALGLLCLAFAAATLVQLPPWKDDYSLYTWGLRHAPNNNLVANNLANILFERGRAQEAERLHHIVLARRPDFYLSLFNLGRYNYLQGNYAAAESFFLRGVRAKPNDPDMHMYLGRTWLRLGRTSQAVRAMENAIKLKPSDPAFHFALGVVFRQAGRLEDALREFSTALSLDPRMDSARQQASEVSALLGNAK